MLVPVPPALHVIVPVQPVAVNVAFSAPQTPILSEAITGAAGVLVRVITIPRLGLLSPQLFVHVAVYVPAVLTAILVVVAPVLQVIVPVHPVADKVANSLPQMFVVLAVTVGTDGAGVFVIITALLFPLSPQEFVQIAVYVPDVLTVILLPVAFVLHFTVPLHPVAVKVAVWSPQSASLFALMTGGAGADPVVITS